MLQTKLHRPPLSAEHVLRHRLIDELNRNIYKPLSLICAPAGYGKSMVASSWIEESAHSSAWLSLNEDEDDLHSFCIYIITAIQNIFPGKMTKTESIINARELPSVKLISHSLINELDQIELPFIIVLDDYHLIHNNDIHELIDELLRYPPENLHLCILTRRDPAIRIKTLRAHNRLTEFRIQDLSFLEEEIISLFNNIHGIILSKSIASSLYKTTEGWIAALRLASMAAKRNLDIEETLGSFKGDLNTLTEFLSEEIISGLSAEMQELLFVTALLKSFCLDLITACFFESENYASEEQSIEELFGQLVNSDLFLIPLDNELKWFRYHHLFQKFTTKYLGYRIGLERIKKNIYIAASKWFEKEGNIDKALDNLILAEEFESAAKLVEKKAHQEFLKGVGKVETWLNKLPTELRENSPSLLLIKAWHAFGQFHLNEIPPILKRVSELWKDEEPEPLLLAELNFFQGNFQYWMGDTKGSIQTLTTALNLCDNLPVHVESNIELVFSIALQKDGNYDEIVPKLKKIISSSDKDAGVGLAYVYGSLTFVQLLSGKLRNALKVAIQMQMYCEKIEAEFLLNWSYYLQALATLQLYQTEKAFKHFEIIGEKHFIVDTKAVFDAKAAIALIHEFNSKSADAIKQIIDAIDYATEIKDPQSLEVVLSAQARIALMQGDLQKATDWAKTFNEPPGFPGIFFWQEVPWLTKAKVLLHIGTQDSLEQAQELLIILYNQAVHAHLDFQLVEINLLLSIVFFKTEQVPQGLEKINDALLQAELNGFVRPFIEIGDLALEPLEMMEERNVCVEFVNKITTLIKERKDLKAGISKKQSLLTTNNYDAKKVILTARELETLYMLASGLRNKEIANKIYVSEGTVKKHIYNIGQKFNTKTRVEHIMKARELGYISDD